MTHQLVLDLDSMGRKSSVLVDGTELAGVVRGVRLDAHAGELTHVVLELVVNARVLVTDGKTTHLVGLGNKGGAGDTLVEAVERLLEVLRQDERDVAPVRSLSSDA